MTAPTPLREVKLVLPMAPDMELMAGQTASALAAWIGMSSDRAGEVEMAVVEACINAFEHSHAEDHRVDIQFLVFGGTSPERLEIRVHDNGVGFAPDEIENPKLEVKLSGGRKRGWGLRIIQGLMDSVRIDSGARGTTVVMSKSR